MVHPASGTIYEFAGVGYIQFMRTANAEGRTLKETTTPKKRKQKTDKVANPRENTRNTRS